MIVFGIDPSTQRVSIAWAGDQQGVATRSFDTRLRGGERLWHIYAETFALCRDLPRPDYVMVEQPFAFAGRNGNRVEPISYMAMGQIMTAVFRATGAPVDPIRSPSWWKKRSVGNGRASKGDVMRWALERGYAAVLARNTARSPLQDEADAWAMAHAALNLRAPAGT